MGGSSTGIFKILTSQCFSEHLLRWGELEFGDWLSVCVGALTVHALYGDMKLGAVLRSAWPHTDKEFDISDFTVLFRTPS